MRMNQPFYLFSWNCAMNFIVQGAPLGAWGICMGNYSGLLEICQRRGKQLQYKYEARRRTASPARRKSRVQRVGRPTAAVARAIDPSTGADQGAGRPLGPRQSHEQ